MNLRFPVLLLGVFILPPDTRATTIVAVRTPASVLVGTDSKMTAADGSAIVGQCKIATANSVYWAAANLKKDEQHNFDLDEIAAAAMRGPGSVSDTPCPIPSSGTCAVSADCPAAACLGKFAAQLVHGTSPT